MRLAAPRSMLVRKRRRHGLPPAVGRCSPSWRWGVLLMPGALHPPPHALALAPQPPVGGRAQLPGRLPPGLWGPCRSGCWSPRRRTRSTALLVAPSSPCGRTSPLRPVASPRAEGNRSRGGRGGGYRLIPRPHKQQDSRPRRGTGRPRRRMGRTKRRPKRGADRACREEAPSARSPRHRGSRHPL